MGLDVNKLWRPLDPGNYQSVVGEGGLGQGKWATRIIALCLNGHLSFRKTEYNETWYMLQNRSRFTYMGGMLIFTFLNMCNPFHLLL